MPEPLLRVAVANDYQIVIEGLAAMLDRFDDIEAVELGATPEAVDIVLYDTFGRDGLFGRQLAELVEIPSVRHVAVFTLTWADALTRVALDRGVSGVLSKTLEAPQLAAGLRQIADGHVVVLPPARRPARSSGDRKWPGRDFKLSERESEVVVLLAQGLRNQDIAAALDLSEDTVKTHLKRAYRKLDVANRAQATNVVLRHPAFRLERTAAPHRL